MLTGTACLYYLILMQRHGIPWIKSTVHYTVSCICSLPWSQTLCDKAPRVLNSAQPPSCPTVYCCSLRRNPSYICDMTFVCHKIRHILTESSWCISCRHRNYTGFSHWRVCDATTFCKLHLWKVHDFIGALSVSNHWEPKDTRHTNREMTKSKETRERIGYKNKHSLGEGDEWKRQIVLVTVMVTKVIMKMTVMMLSSVHPESMKEWT